MENTEMSDSVVIVIQPTTDDVKNELQVEEYTAQISSPPPSDSNVALQYDTMLTKTNKDEQGLLIPLGVPSEVKPEIVCNIKQENINDITESLDVQPDAQHDFIPQYQLDGDNPGYSNTLIIKQECSEDITETSATVEVPWHQPDVNPSTGNSDQPLKTSGTDHIGYNVTEDILVRNEQFTDNNQVSKHIRTHSDEKPYTCPNCDKQFSRKSNLTRHIWTHTGEKPFSCPYCDKPFSSRSYLTVHIRTHTGETPFSCSYCDKQFNCKSNLSRHIRTHTGEKPFACPHCAKCFTSSSGLTVHITTHTGKKTFSCPQCDKRYTQKYNLSLHARTHAGDQPVSWFDCDKRSRDKNIRSKRIRTHTREKPFSCPYCDKCFNRKSHLSTHIRLHTGEKPFSCPHCDKRFSDKSVLSKHLRTHIRDKPCSCDKRFLTRRIMMPYPYDHIWEIPGLVYIV